MWLASKMATNRTCGRKMSVSDFQEGRRWSEIDVRRRARREGRDWTKEACGRSEARQEVQARADVVSGAKIRTKCALDSKPERQLSRILEYSS
jgi:hypothetical protein